ncbi:MAG: hypothetical protein KAT17_09560 [Candidatus Aminicenantes bacterium]|nr:hypothetical protein [Candidatus Aminicenantes bacterium]
MTNGRMIFIFLDGVGIGKPSPSNPFFVSNSEYLPLYTGNPGWPDRTPVKPIDPLFGIKGLPQSATGQTTLYTGQIIPRLLNKHQGTYPNKLMRKIIKQYNILALLKKNRFRVSFINAYPVFAPFFTSNHVNIHHDGQIRFSKQFPEFYKKRISVTSCMMILSQQKPFDEKDVESEKSIFQDYSNLTLKERGLHLPEFSPEKAAEIIFNKSREFDFILYEYFQTDIFGHRKPIRECINLVENLNRLIRTLVASLDKKTDTLLITSDHGNLEDCSIRTHTLNPVPLILWGNNLEKMRNQINTIADISPAILDYFTFNPD